MDNEEITNEGQTFEETETPTESLPETTQTEASESSPEVKKEDVASVPFNEDPKIQDYINRQVESRASKVREEIEQSISQRFSPKEETHIPSWFGGDEEAYKAFKEDQAKLVEEAEARTLKAIEQRTQKEQEAVRSAQAYLEDQFKEIEKEHGSVDRNKVLKYISDLAEEGVYLVDKQNRWAIKKAYNLMPKDNPDPSLEAKKKAASLTVSESKAESKPAAYGTPGLLRRKGW